MNTWQATIEKLDLSLTVNGQAKVSEFKPRFTKVANVGLLLKTKSMA
ncbi:hypothetical protein HPTD01_832 [Halomonas sp. TD01]|nr:hypothetical protein GME_12659 [Halomonas sp. TD01]CAH1042354.1 hypothetical protein HPTD01_832 [Halomonas sp. TD01]